MTMKITIILILTIIAVVLIIIGCGLFNFVDIRQRYRKTGTFFSFYMYRKKKKELTNADIKLRKIGWILVCLGILIIVILRLTVGPKIKLGRNEQQQPIKIEVGMRETRGQVEPTPV
jgi:hypothetical protein